MYRKLKNHPYRLLRTPETDSIFTKNIPSLIPMMANSLVSASRSSENSAHPVDISLRPSQKVDPWPASPSSFPSIHRCITPQNVFIVLAVLVLFEKTFQEHGNQLDNFVNHIFTTLCDHASISLIHLWIVIPFIICSFVFEKIQWSLWEHGNVPMYQFIKHAKYTSIIVLLCSLCVAISKMEKWTPLSFFVTVVTVSVSLKIYSYFRDNDIIRQTQSTAIKADQICTVRYLIRFLICPTLIYQNSLKCLALVRPSRVIYHFSCFIISATLSVILTVQWSIPIVSSIMGKNNPGANELFMAWLNLSIPVTITWLAGFVGFFHHWCHMAAELTGFPETERHFYLDWWNSSDIAGFWRRWNLPVHLFSLQYIYKPLRSSGYSKLHASGIVFFISAILHELVFAVSLNIFHSPIGFIGMFGQIPLQILCKRKAWGEYLVGLMVVLGLSAGVLGYSLAMVFL